jgi:hypothetical protein
MLAVAPGRFSRVASSAQAVRLREAHDAGSAEACRDGGMLSAAVLLTADGMIAGVTMRDRGPASAAGSGTNGLDGYKVSLRPHACSLPFGSRTTAWARFLAARPYRLRRTTVGGFWAA